MVKPLRYYALGREVLLSGVKPGESKLICTAVSNRLAEKIVSNMNLMESRQQKAHEIFAYGTGNPKKKRA